MFIRNLNAIKTKIFKCDSKLGKYLIEHKIPLLSIDEDKNYIFGKTEELDNIIKNLNWFQKILYKIK